jgi:hypothetical protein
METRGMEILLFAGSTGRFVSVPPPHVVHGPHYGKSAHQAAETAIILMVAGTRKEKVCCSTQGV